MILLKIAKVFLQLGIILGILKLFSSNGFNLDHFTKLQNIHGKMFVFGFFGTLLSLEKIIILDKDIHFLFKLSPLCFTLGTIVLIINTFIKSVCINFYVTLIAHTLFFTGGLLLTLFYLKDLLYKRTNAPSQYFFILGSLILSIASIYSLKFTTLLDARNPEFFLLFPIFVILGERLDFMRIFVNKFIVGVQFSLGTITFIMYIISIFYYTYNVEKYLLLLLITISFVTEAVVGKIRPTKFSKIFNYIKITLTISYIFAIVGVLLMIYRRFEPGFHALSLGFVFGMIFSHAIIIFPSIIAKKLPKDEQVSFIPFIIFTLANILRVLSSMVIYTGFLSQRYIPFFSIVNISSGFVHLLSIILLFLMVKSIIKIPPVKNQQ